MNDRTTPPPDLLALGRERSRARRMREFDKADELKAQIQAAGWKVIDRGTEFALVPATPPSVEIEGATLYGHASAVPSVLDEAPDRAFSLLLVAQDRPDDLARTLAALRRHAPAGTQVIIVADAPTGSQAAHLASDSSDLQPVAGEAPVVLRTSQRLGIAAALNVGLRQARGSVVVIADGTVEPVGDALSPLADALADGDVAVAGAVGYATRDLRSFEEVDGPEAAVIGLGWLAFRRADAVAAGPGPLDEKFTYPGGLGTWWSLVLRDGPDGDAAPAPRAARRLALPVALHEFDDATTGGERAERLAKRNHYRILDRFRGRTDLLSGG